MGFLSRWRWYLVFAGTLLALFTTYVLIREPSKRRELTNSIVKGAIEDKIEIVKKADQQYREREVVDQSRVEQIDLKLKELETKAQEVGESHEDVVSVSEFFRHLKL